MNNTQHMDLELQKKLCYFYWDIFNSPELKALSPSTSHPTVFQYSTFVLSIVICIFGLSANIMVIFVTGFLLKKNKYKIWFLNLALGDFIFLLLLPLNAVSVIRGEWLYGSIMCKVYNFHLFANMNGGVYILIALNIDRALAITKPLWHRRFRSWRFCWCICAVIWISSALCNISVLIYSDVYNISEPQCLLFHNALNGIVFFNNNQNSSESQKWVNSSLHDLCDKSIQSIKHFQNFSEILSSTMSSVVPHILIAYIIPLCIILFCNIVIALQVKNSQKMSSSRRPYTVVTAAVLVFFCIRTPIVVAYIIFMVAAHTLQFTLMYKVIMVFPLLIKIATIDTFLNPMVYVLIAKEVRNEISKFFGRLARV